MTARPCLALAALLCAAFAAPRAALAQPVPQPPPPAATPRVAPAPKTPVAPAPAPKTPVAPAPAPRAPAAAAGVDLDADDPAIDVRPAAGPDEPLPADAAAAPPDAAPPDAAQPPPGWYQPPAPPYGPRSWIPEPRRRARPPAPAAEEARPAEVIRPQPEPEPEPEGPYVPHWMTATVGMRNTVVFDEGFEPYAEGNLLPQLALGATFVPLRFGVAGFGLSAEYDLGGRAHHARYVETDLTAHRIGVGVTAQVDFERLVVFARAMPGLWYVAATLDDSSYPRPLVADGWAWGFDALGGAALRLGSAGGPRSDPAARFWLLAELGYAFAGRIGMAFSPEADDDDPRQYGTVELPDLRPAGFVSRAAFGVSF